MVGMSLLHGLTKKQILENFISLLNEELKALTQAALASHEAATHSESVAEDPHDTRGIEASYLAGAQSQRVVELQKQIQMFHQLPARPWAKGEPIGLGAVVELVLEGRHTFHLLAPTAGGLNLKVGEGGIQVVTLQSPLGEALEGAKAGESIEVEIQKATREYEIRSVF